MARILLASWGSYGDVYPYVGVAFALKDRGHHPVLATAEFYRGLIEPLGFEFHPTGRMIDPSDDATIARVLDPVRGADPWSGRSSCHRSTPTTRRSTTL